MAQFPLSELRTYWKNISDWIKGVDSVSRPKVDAQLTGSILEQDRLKVIAEDKVKVFQTPIGFDWKTHPLNNKILLNIQTDEVIVDFDVSDYQPTGTTYYVSKTGSDSNDGLTLETALASVHQAIQKPNVGTVMIDEGVYPRNRAFNGLQANRNVSIKGIDGKKVVLGTHDNLSWSLESGQTNTYKASRSAVSRVVDAKFTNDDGDFVEMTKMTSIAEVESTPNSWYTDGSFVYVHTKDSRVADNNILALMGVYGLENRGVYTTYIENVELMGGLENIRITPNGAGEKAYLYGKNAKFSYSTSSNGVEIMGADVILQNCEAVHAVGDGFNYHIDGEVNCNVIEINCIGRDNGNDTDNDNGSSIHDGGKIIRVNGSYYRNIGPNVADVSDDTDSWNVNCVGYGSKAANVAQNVDFIVATGNAEMWLDRCVGYGSEEGLTIADGSKGYVRNSKFSSENIIGKKYEY